MNSDHSISSSDQSGHCGGSESRNSSVGPEDCDQSAHQPSFHSRQPERGGLGLEHSQYKLSPIGESTRSSSRRYHPTGRPVRFSGVVAPQFSEIDDGLDVPSSSSPSSSHVSSPSPSENLNPGLWSVPTTAAAHEPTPKLQIHMYSSKAHHLNVSDPEEYLRRQMRLSRDKPVNLWAIGSPGDRQKPIQPYPDLVKLAIFGSPHKKLTLQEIYKALIDRFEWFRDRAKETAWKVCRIQLYVKQSLFN